ncbi:hypothetical protein BYT27DRAFT_7072500, partial [Phlegmacium glaucopus]
MPARGERSAPTFDRNRPRELSRFFDELEYFFGRAALAEEADKKKQVLRYIDFEVEQIWKAFPEYSDPTKTYDQFKAAILVHYPDADGDYVYSLRDVDTLIGTHQRLGITTTNDLSEYHLRYVAITTWLIEKQQLGDLEQKRSYLRAFQPALLSAITNRLQMKFPDQHPNIPHKIQHVYESARYILQSSNTEAQGYYAPLPSAPTPVLPPTISLSPAEPAIKTETFNSVFAEFTKTIADALKQTSRIRPAGHQHATTSRNTDCNFCGGAHYIRDCEVVIDYVRAGKCKRNTEGKVVLPSGSYVGRDIPGTLLRERIDEWHHRNPGQLATATLFHAIAQPVPPTSQATGAATSYTLSATDRIATLEAEIFNLQALKSSFAPGVRTRGQRARDQSVIGPSEQPSTPHIVPITTENIPNLQPLATPEHPYQNAKDAAYAPPATRNVGAPYKPSVPNKRPEPAYRTMPPIHQTSIADDIYKRAMEAQITITQRELLSLSPEVRSQVRDVTTTRRVPFNPANVAQHTLQVGDDDDNESVPIPTFAVANSHHRTPPEGALVIPDPIEHYYQSLRPGEAPDPDRLIVSKESTAIRSIFALIDNSQKRECTLDPGCQVVAMSQDTCHSLGLAYDPQIRLNMESANGTLDWSLGLARNVPFQIGTITLYVQVHVIKSPSYDILLGRPFDVLTESIIRNFANEDQTITLSDPNTGQRITIPTFARGTGR